MNDAINAIDPLGLAGLPTNVMSKERAYELASKYVVGDFAHVLLRHYIWGGGRTITLGKKAVLNTLIPVTSLTGNEEFAADILAGRSSSTPKEYRLQTLDLNNPSGGLGHYWVIARVKVCVSGASWSAEGVAQIEDRWDFLIIPGEFVREITTKIRFGQFNLGGRQTRTAAGSLIPGDPFEVRSVEIPVKQTNADGLLKFGP